MGNTHERTASEDRWAEGRSKARSSFRTLRDVGPVACRPARYERVTQSASRLARPLGRRERVATRVTDHPHVRHAGVLADRRKVRIGTRTAGARRRRVGVSGRSRNPGRRGNETRGGLCHGTLQLPGFRGRDGRHRSTGKLCTSLERRRSSSIQQRRSSE